MKILVDDLSSAAIVAFLEDHIEDMKSVSPPESKHALDLEALKADDVTFWSVYNEGDLIACGAIKELTSKHGEIKSMRTKASARAHDQRGKGARLFESEFRDGQYAVF